MSNIDLSQQGQGGRQGPPRPNAPNHADAVNITGGWDGFQIIEDPQPEQPNEADGQLGQERADQANQGNAAPNAVVAPDVVAENNLQVAANGAAAPVMRVNMLRLPANDPEDGYWSGPEGKPLKMSLQNPSTKFDGKNFTSYREMLYPYFRAYNCIGIIEGTEEIPPKSDVQADIDLRNDWKKRHILVEILLTNSLRDSDRMMLTDKKNVADKWKYLRQRYELKPFKSKGKAFAELFTTQWDPKTETGEEFVNRLAKMRLELSAMGRKITDEDMADAICHAVDSVIPNFLDNYTTEDACLQVVMDTFLRTAQKIDEAT